MIKPDVQEFADRIKSYGFAVYVAERGTYGIITDASESRVLSFTFNDGRSLGGNYTPPSSLSGTGWRMEKGPDALTSADAVRDALYAVAPTWTRWVEAGQRYSTLADYLALYGSSSRFTKV